MEMFCSQCGAKAASGKFCEECGAPQSERPSMRKASGGRLPLILGGAAIVAVMLVGGWYLQKAKYSPEVLDAFPPPEAQKQSEPARYEDFVGNWIVKQNGEETVFWIQEVEGRYVGADDFTIMEFSEIQERSIRGMITDGPEINSRVTVILSPDSNGLQFIIAPDQKPEIRYEGTRNTSLGQGIVTTDDIAAMEIMVTAAFKEKETAQSTELAEKDAAFETAIQELGSALRIYYVAEGKRDLSEAETHLREFLMKLSYNGFGMSEDYVEQMVEGALGP